MAEADLNVGTTRSSRPRALRALLYVLLSAMVLLLAVLIVVEQQLQVRLSAGESAPPMPSGDAAGVYRVGGER